MSTYSIFSRWGVGGRLLTFSAFRMGAYSRWMLILGWALIEINTTLDMQTRQDWYESNEYESKY